MALWYVVVTLGSFLLTAVVFAVGMHAQVEHEGQRSAETALERYRLALERGGTDALRSMFECVPSPPSSVAVRLSDERDVELFSMSSGEASQRAIRGNPELHGPTDHVAKDNWHVAFAAVSAGRRLSVALQDEPSQLLWSKMREAAWIIFGCGMGLAILGSFVITRRTLRPVSDLARATQQIVDSGNLGLRVETRDSTAELGHLAELFNKMLAKNEALVVAMRESLDYVAHDLRTPLARLRAGAELALRAEPNVDAAREALAETIEESDRVLSMLTTLTDITEAETGAMHLEVRREDLGAIAREAVDLYELVSAEHGVHVVTRIASGVDVLIDRRRIRQVCANLIDNAIKYTPSGGQVEVVVTRAEPWGIFTVTDTGIGIAPEDRERVWQRLFRSDRSRAERGLGLGLSLVKAVVEAHTGEVRLESELGAGSTFEVRLKLAPSDP